MRRIEEIALFMEQAAPCSLAEPWDNVGLLVNCEKPVQKVLVTLDITHAVIAEAEKKGCQAIVSHHPVIFHPLKALSPKDPAFLLVQKGISAVCAHTNLDSATGGVSDTLAGLFRLTEVESFMGCGRVGSLPQSLSGRELGALCAKTLGADPVLLCDAGRPVRRLAVVGGAGGDFFKEAAARGADCLLTGEVGHHDALDACALGISTLAAGHFYTEWPVVPRLAAMLRQSFPELAVEVSGENRSPFCRIEELSKEGGGTWL